MDVVETTDVIVPVVIRDRAKRWKVLSNLFHLTYWISEKKIEHLLVMICFELLEIFCKISSFLTEVEIDIVVFI